MAIEQVPKEQEVAHGATINLDAGKTLCWADRGRHYENQSDESSRRTKL